MLIVVMQRNVSCLAAYVARSKIEELLVDFMCFGLHFTRTMNVRKSISLPPDFCNMVIAHLSTYLSSLL